MTTKNQTIDVEIPLPEPITRGNVFATFIEEAFSLMQEVAARRTFDDDVALYLKSKNLIDEFDAFRQARNKKPEAD